MKTKQKVKEKLKQIEFVKGKVLIRLSLKKEKCSEKRDCSRST